MQIWNILFISLLYLSSEISSLSVESDETTCEVNSMTISVKIVYDDSTGTKPIRVVYICAWFQAKWDAVPFTGYNRYPTIIDLTYLSFSGNNVSALPAFSADLIAAMKLDTLRLEDMGLEDISCEGFESVARGSRMYMGYNNLRTVPGLCGLGFSIRLLDLSHNSILGTDDHSFTGLTGLWELILEGNTNISTGMNDVIHKLPNSIKTLNFQNCSLTDGDVTSFSSKSGLTGMNTILLSVNCLTTIPQFHSDSAKNLQHLYITDNTISYITDKILDQLPAVLFLDLSNNYICEVPKLSSFSDPLHGLMWLNIKNNNVKRVVEMAFEYTKTDVHLHGNNIICDRQLAWIKDNYIFKVYLDAYPCKWPSSLLDVAFYQIAKEDLLVLSIVTGQSTVRIKNHNCDKNDNTNIIYKYGILIPSNFGTEVCNNNLAYENPPVHCPITLTTSAQEMTSEGQATTVVTQSITPSVVTSSETDSTSFLDAATSLESNSTQSHFSETSTKSLTYQTAEMNAVLSTSSGNTVFEDTTSKSTEITSSAKSDTTKNDITIGISESTSTTYLTSSQKEMTSETQATTEVPQSITPPVVTSSKTDSTLYLDAATTESHLTTSPFIETTTKPLTDQTAEVSTVLWTSSGNAVFEDTRSKSTEITSSVKSDTTKNDIKIATSKSTSTVAGSAQDVSTTLLDSLLSTMSTIFHNTTAIHTLVPTLTLKSESDTITQNSILTSIKNYSTLDMHTHAPVPVYTRRRTGMKSLVAQVSKGDPSRTQLARLKRYYKTPVEAPRSVFIGTVAIIFISVELALAMISDLHYLIIWFKRMRKMVKEFIRNNIKN